MLPNRITFLLEKPRPFWVVFLEHDGSTHHTQRHGVVGDGKPVTPVDLELACELSLEFRMRIDKLARLGEAVLLEDSSRCRIPLQAS